MEQRTNFVSRDNPYDASLGGQNTGELEIALRYNPIDVHRISNPDHTHRFIKGWDPNNMQLLPTTPNKAIRAAAWILRREPPYYAYLTIGSEKTRSTNKIESDLDEQR